MVEKGASFCIWVIMLEYNRHGSPPERALWVPHMINASSREAELYMKDGSNTHGGGEGRKHCEGSTREGGV